MGSASKRNYRTPRTKQGSELIDRHFLIPVSCFPGLRRKALLHGVVKGFDNYRRDCLIVRLRGDPLRYFFPIDVVRQWPIDEAAEAEPNRRHQAAQEAKQVPPAAPFEQSGVPPPVPPAASSLASVPDTRRRSRASTAQPANGGGGGGSAATSAVVDVTASQTARLSSRPASAPPAAATAVGGTMAEPRRSTRASASGDTAKAVPAAAKATSSHSARLLQGPSAGQGGKAASKGAVGQDGDTTAKTAQAAVSGPAAVARVTEGRKRSRSVEGLHAPAPPAAAHDNASTSPEPPLPLTYPAQRPTRRVRLASAALPGGAATSVAVCPPSATVVTSAASRPTVSGATAGPSAAAARGPMTSNESSQLTGFEVTRTRPAGSGAPPAAMSSARVYPPCPPHVLRRLTSYNAAHIPQASHDHSALRRPASGQASGASRPAAAAAASAAVASNKAPREPRTGANPGASLRTRTAAVVPRPAPIPPATFNAALPKPVDHSGGSWFPADRTPAAGSAGVGGEAHTSSRDPRRAGVPARPTPLPTMTSQPFEMHPAAAAAAGCGGVLGPNDLPISELQHTAQRTSVLSPDDGGGDDDISPGVGLIRSAAASIREHLGRSLIAQRNGVWSHHLGSPDFLPYAAPHSAAAGMAHHRSDLLPPGRLDRGHPHGPRRGVPPYCSAPPAYMTDGPWHVMPSAPQPLEPGSHVYGRGGSTVHDAMDGGRWRDPRSAAAAATAATAGYDASDAAAVGSFGQLADARVFDPNDFVVPYQSQAAFDMSQSQLGMDDRGYVARDHPMEAAGSGGMDDVEMEAAATAAAAIAVDGAANARRATAPPPLPTDQLLDVPFPRQTHRAAGVLADSAGGGGGSQLPPRPSRRCARVTSDDAERVMAGAADGSVEVRMAAAAAKTPKRSRRKTSKAEVSDLLDTVVMIPAHVFRVDVPQMFYSAHVEGPDTSHPASVVVKLEGESQRYYFSAEQVRQWRDMAAADMEAGATTGPQSVAFAAEVLSQMSLSKTSASHALGGASLTSAARRFADEDCATSPPVKAR